MKIFLVGGGTGGPTAPLLAIAEAALRLEPDIELVFIGARGGIDKQLLDSAGLPIKYLTIPAGKWRRYFSLRNFLDLLKIVFGFFWSLYLVHRYRPDVVFGAGSYVQVPFAWAAFLCRVPRVIHQQDFQVLLSTKLVAPIASRITLTFSFHQKKFSASAGLLRRFPKSRTVVTGNPVRAEILRGDRSRARTSFKLGADRPTILVTGGGGGAERLNQLIYDSLPELLKYVEVIHLVGRRHKTSLPDKIDGYHPYDFLGGELLADAYAVADLVVSRAGMSTISELSALGKPAILIPLPSSPQVYNARLLNFLHCAVVLPQTVKSESLVDAIRKILWNGETQAALSANIKKLMPQGADKRIARLLIDIGKKNANSGKP